jgi:hypothetical protein
MPRTTAVLDFFTVEYEAGDSAGALAALLSLSHLFILVGIATLVAFRRELHCLSIFAGLCVCEGLCRVLKKTVRETRPQGALARLSICWALISPHVVQGDFVFPRDEYGMPSSHSAFAWWLAMYTVLHCVWRCPFPPATLSVHERSTFPSL